MRATRLARCNYAKRQGTFNRIGGSTLAHENEVIHAGFFSQWNLRAIQPTEC